VSTVRQVIRVWPVRVDSVVKAPATVVAAVALVLCSLTAAGRPASDAVVGVSPAGPVRTVTPTLFGLNGVDTTGPPWSNKHLLAALSTFFGAGVLRIPGGTAANYWNWRDGWFQPASTRWPAEPRTPVDDRLPVFNDALKASGETPVYVLNPLTYKSQIGSARVNQAMLRSQLQFLEAAAARGWPVTMVELGNELYLNGATHTSKDHAHDYEERFPTAADYARQMNPWIAAIHRAFPGVKVAAVGTDANDLRGITPRRSTWNARVLPVLRGEDAMTIHVILREGDPTASPGTVLAYPYLHLQKLKAHELKLMRSYKLPVWITAFGMSDATPDHVLRGTWLQGLFVGEEALEMLGIPAIENLELPSSVGKARDVIFDGPHGFGPHGPATVPFALTAQGTTVSVIQRALHRATKLQALSFSPEPKLGRTSAPAVVGDELTTTAGPELLLENLSAQPVSLNLASIFRARFTATQIRARTVRTPVTGPASTTARKSTGSGRLRLAPYALAEVSG
jgi:hypothetical protein